MLRQSCWQASLIPGRVGTTLRIGLANRILPSTLFVHFGFYLFFLLVSKGEVSCHNRCETLSRQQLYRFTSYVLSGKIFDGSLPVYPDDLHSDGPSLRRIVSTSTTKGLEPRETSPSEITERRRRRDRNIKPRWTHESSRQNYHRYATSRGRLWNGERGERKKKERIKEK